jgi:hypothetical protein
VDGGRCVVDGGAVAWRRRRWSYKRGVAACKQKKGGRSRRGAGQGRTRHRCTRAALRRGKAGASAGPATGEGGVTVQGNNMQSDDVQGCGVQCMAVSPLSELRPRPVGVQESRARCGRSCSVAATGGSAQEQRDRTWRMSEAVEEKAVDEIRRHCELLVEDLKVARCEQTTALAEAEGRLWQSKPEGEAAKHRRWSGVTSSEEVRCSQARRALFIHTEVRAELNWRVRECKRNCFASGRLSSILQASARARQQATHEQVKTQWCERRAEAVHRRCDLARRSCRRLRECADRVSAAHAREQWRLRL